ncbi:8262_t:CDS:2, partial [Acaulospora morrowiae]
QLSGMTLAATFNLLGSPGFVSRLIVDRIFKAPRFQDQKSQCILNRMGIKIPVSLIDEHGWSGDEPLMLVVSRGLLSNLSRSTLIYPISLDCEYAVVALRSYSNIKSLHHILFISIEHFSNKALSVQTKVVAFETMGIWLEETEGILGDPCNNDQETMGIRSIFSSDLLEKLMSYVWNNWDDPVEAIQYKVKTIFERLLDVYYLKCHLENSTELYDQFQMGLLKRLLAMDSYRKVKYALLSLLLPRIGTEIFLEIQTDFVSSVLEVFQNLVIAPRAAQLLVLFLDQYFNEIVKSSSKGTSNDVQHEDIEGQWAGIWLGPICKGLSSSDEILRKNIGAFVLKPLFKSRPNSFWKLLEKLQDQKNSEGFIKDDQYRLNALIMILKIAKSLDIIDSGKFIEDPSNNKRFCLESLRDATHHLDPNIRIDILGLICESQKSTTEITSVELSLLQSFFKMNLNSTSPEFRQKLY